MIKSVLLSALLLLLVILFIFIKIRKKRNQKTRINDVNAEELKRWKKERRDKSKPLSLNVQAMGDNIEKSHELWKRLSKMVHESRWIGSSPDKINLAAELNSLINENKGNYNELKKLEIRIHQELRIQE